MTIRVRDAMRTEVHTIDPDLPLSEFEQRSMERHATGFPVMEEGKLVGIISRSDIVRTLTVERTYDDQLYDQFDGAVPQQPGEIAESVAERGARIGARLAKFTVRDAMRKDVVTIGPDETIETLSRLMVEHRVHRLPVVEGGRLVGIISTLDLVRLVADGRLGAV